MIEKSLFGKTHEGIEISLYKITNSAGSSLSVIDYGAIIQSLNVPDKQGAVSNVVLGFDTLLEYQHDRHYIGAIIGRYANRISKSEFSIDGVLFKLTQNDGDNHLHGGRNGFNKVIWNADDISDSAIRLTYLSPDGENGYPGNVRCEVVYTLTDSNEVRIEYRAMTDKTTIINLSNHSYFNLSQKKNSVGDHELQIHAKSFLPVTHELIPTGELVSVENSPFDFLHATTIGSRLQSVHTQLQYGNGYDQCWILDHPNSGIRKVAALVEPISGRSMEVFTDKPGLQVYTGNYLSGNFSKHAGVCLETQHFPDSPNHQNFPSPLLHPGETYTSTTMFKFSIQ